VEHRLSVRVEPLLMALVSLFASKIGSQRNTCACFFAFKMFLSHVHNLYVFRWLGS
jgi:hypothetical protein